MVDSVATSAGVRLIFYDPSRGLFVEVEDREYKPYFYIPHPPTHEDEIIVRAIGGKASIAEKIDLFTGEVRRLTRVEVENPKNLKRLSSMFKISWEGDIPFSLGYIYDHNLVFGVPYHIEGGIIKPAYRLTDDLKGDFEERFGDIRASDPEKYRLIEKFFTLCSQPIPEIPLKDLGIREEVSSEDLYLTFTISRVTNLPISSAYTDRRVSIWIRSILNAYLRSRNILIPKPEELMRGGVEKRIQGGLTMPPESGIYFNTVVLDFESLYPSLIDAYNLSYETIDCNHSECSANTVPSVNHHVCKLRRGVYSILIGALKDLRIRWFKPLSKDKSIPDEERRLADATAKLLKLILVASYGVTVRTYGLAQPALAESITAYGRYALKEAWRMAVEAGLHPIYGDTDSLFLDDPPDSGVTKLIESVKRRLKLDLAVDKRYSICVLPRAMKSYLGIMKDGTADLKGLTAIKSNSPRFIQKVFGKCVNELKDVRNWGEFELAKDRILKIFNEAVAELRYGKVPIDDLAYTVRLHFNPFEKDETLHQPYQCAVQLLDLGIKVHKGDVISFVKVKPFNYKGRTFTVKPTSLIDGFHEVNVEDYIKNLTSALNQVFKPMGITFHEGEGKPLTLTDFL